MSLARIKHLNGIGVDELRSHPYTFTTPTNIPAPTSQGVVFLTNPTGGSVATLTVGAGDKVETGRRVRLVVISAANTITITHTALASRAKGRVFLANGGSDRTLSASDRLELEQDQDGYWFEVALTNA